MGSSAVFLRSPIGILVDPVAIVASWCEGGAEGDASWCAGGGGFVGAWKEGRGGSDLLGERTAKGETAGRAGSDGVGLGGSWSVEAREGKRELILGRALKRVYAVSHSAVGRKPRAVTAAREKTKLIVVEFQPAERA